MTKTGSQHHHPTHDFIRLRKNMFEKMILMVFTRPRVVSLIFEGQVLKARMFTKVSNKTVF